MIPIDLLVGRDFLVSSHAGTRLPIAVFSSQGAPPPMGSFEQCFALLPSRILKCYKHGESFCCCDLLRNFQKIPAFFFDIISSKDAGYHGNAIDICSGKF